jgi:hypothetical protein
MLTSHEIYFPKIKGANDLKKYINDISELTEGIYRKFTEDIQQPKARVEEQCFPRNNRWEFCAKMCVLDHEDLVYNHMTLPFSTVLQSKKVVMECIAELENIRKMIVTNKQQKRTTIRRIKHIIKLASQTHCQRMMYSPTFDFVMMNDNNSEDENALDRPDTDSMLIELETDCDTVKGLKNMIELTKQNHRTISQRLLGQVEWIMKNLHSHHHHHILAFTRSAEDTIGEIIHHAEKCRAYIAHCRHIALVEYCASIWWFETQKDAMDHSNYHIYAELVDSQGKYCDAYNKFDANRLYATFGADVIHNHDEYMKTKNIRIVVVEISLNGGEEFIQRVVDTEILNKELYDTIFTEDAINAFENERHDIWMRRQQILA